MKGLHLKIAEILESEDFSLWKNSIPFVNFYRLDCIKGITNMFLNVNISIF